MIKEELGWVGQLEYQQFLYPNEKDMRKLLMWLVDKLPKGGGSGDGDDLAAEESALAGQSGALPMGRAGLLEDQINETLRFWCRERFNPLTAELRSRQTSSGRSFSTVPLEYPNANEPHTGQFFLSQLLSSWTV